MNREALSSLSSSDGERRGIEALMDAILADSFPASDPPAWGTAAGRVNHLEGRERRELDQRASQRTNMEPRSC